GGDPAERAAQHAGAGGEAGQSRRHTRRHEPAPIHEASRMRFRLRPICGSCRSAERAVPLRLRCCGSRGDGGGGSNPRAGGSTEDPSLVSRMSRMRPVFPRFLLLLALAMPAPVVAQQDVQAPVRYDADHHPPEFHRGRRAEVAGRLPDTAVAIFFGAPTRNRSNDVSYEYRQDSDFLYLTGSHEAGSVLLLVPGGAEVDGR